LKNKKISEGYNEIYNLYINRQKVLKEGVYRKSAYTLFKLLVTCYLSVAFCGQLLPPALATL